MSNKNFLLAGAVSVSVIASGAWLAHAAGFLTNGLPLAGGSQYPFTLPLTGIEQFPADTEISGGAAPQSEAVTTGMLAAGFSQPSTPRNYLMNGDIAVSQQGTAETVGGTTTMAFGQALADRWYVDTNVGSGAGYSAIVTSSPSPLSGFQRSLKVYRKAGALTQQVCLVQEIETSRATQLAGKNVVLSAYMQALAGMTATASAVTFNIITGTGTDQGLATLTASPAITPAWTAVAVANASTVNLTTSWARYNSAVTLIPTNATEVGVEICMTPVGSSSGTTDGFAIVGAQLEQTMTPVGGITSPSPYEFQQIQTELRDSQRFYYWLTEASLNTGGAVNGFCQATGSTAGSCTLNLPVTMRGTLPVVSIPTTGTFKVNIAGTATTWVSPTAGVCSPLACTITIGNTNTAGQAETWTAGSGSGTGTINVVSDVVM